MTDLVRRAGQLERVAGLLGRGVPLPLILGDGPAQDAARRAGAQAAGAALAGEGRPLADALRAAGLIEAAEVPLVAAAEGRDPAGALRLLGRELRARVEVDRTLGEALRRPARKVLVAAGVVFALSAVLGVEVGVLGRGATATGWAGQLDAIGAEAHVFGAGLVLAGLVGLVLALARTALGGRLLERAARDLPLLSTLLGLEVAARALRVLGTGLAAGLDLPRALERVRDAFPGRQTGREVDALVVAARDGADLVSCLGRAGFVPPTAQWLAGVAVERSDPARELLALADDYEARLVRECAHWAPLLSGVADSVIVVCVGLPLVLATLQLKRIFAF